MILRDLYRGWMPLPLRKLRWALKNGFQYIFRDRNPSVLVLDYEGYWERREREGRLDMSYQATIKWSEQLINKGARVLDVGCGNGQFLATLKDNLGIDELGVDISGRAVELARRKGIRAEVFDVAKDDITSLGEFDFVTCFEVLEHVPNAESLLAAVRQVAPRLLVTIPNTGFFLYRLRLLFGRFPYQWIQHPAEHVRFWTLRDFQITANFVGYRVKRIYPIEGVRFLDFILPSLFAPDLFFMLEPEGQARSIRRK